jgi:hypothetical protein
MMCLTVRTSIHPTSKPTGTDADMGGNDKAEALAGTDLERHGRNGRLQRNFFSNPDNSTGIGHLWHLPGQNAPAGNGKNTGCGLAAIHPAISTGGPGIKVTEEPGLQSAGGRISSLNWRIIVLF